MSTFRVSSFPLRLLASVSKFATRICGLVVVGMAFLIAIDVVVRKLFATTLMSGGVGEISGYVLAIITAWGAASATRRIFSVRSLAENDRSAFRPRLTLSPSNT